MHNNDRKHLVMLMLLAGILIFIGAKYSSIFADIEKAAPVREERLIAVYVKGAVENPGYYELPAASRLNDLLQLCVLTADADTEELNPARYLVDGEAIVIPFLPQENAGAVASGGITDGRVNINTANMQELMSLPMIGEVRARAIINYRENHGPFGRTGEIMKVAGISTAIYKAVKDLICTE